MSPARAVLRWAGVVTGLLAVAAAHLLARGGADPATAAEALLGDRSGLDHRIVAELGAPRLVTALLTGAALGVAGLVLQTALRNPLAAPEFTGVNPGAVLGILAGLQSGLVPADSAGGALAAALAGGAAGGLVTWVIAGRSDAGGLVVAGLLGGALLAGFTTLLLAYQPSRFGNALRWLIGSVEGRVWEHLAHGWWWVCGWTLLAWAGAAALGVLSGGDEHAASLGLNPRVARALLLGAAIALSAGAASLAGAVSFVGLVVPHAARWASGGDPRRGVPLAALLGAGAVTLADAVAQVATRLLADGGAAHRLGVPTGVVTALAGAAVLVTVARRSRHLPG
ncbi:iron chelate uptake ABC transporter family permease subunit [Bailinhaonella thermotolerans]|uniref:iron chelate uptake ABC transporter family permease subunit n=1 Tax=Bailinhaonella thermotolerans TaxID=1070861 RepID=UPI00192A68B5|nr:iron chelate uptake ABC transporter family permease subunit [Bailinhaonella thermotolerans]